MLKFVKYDQDVLSIFTVQAFILFLPIFLTIFLAEDKNP